jgi:hypothetical protein
MIFSSKSLSVWMMGSRLSVSAMAWAEPGCVTQDCSQMAVQVEQLRATGTIFFSSPTTGVNLVAEQDH